MFGWFCFRSHYFVQKFVSEFYPCLITVLEPVNSVSMIVLYYCYPGLTPSSRLTGYLNQMLTLSTDCFCLFVHLYIQYVRVMITIEFPYMEVY